jgi:4,5-dihydroxyphthalate decarboxylase
MSALKLKTVLGDHAHMRPLRTGDIRSDKVALEFIDFTPTNAAFKPMVREQKFDVCEMAIVTYLMARAYNKPLALLPATMVGRYQHPYALYNAERGRLGPGDLKGKRVGIRSFTTTTGAWIRGILANDHGVDLDSIRWVTFEDPHVAEYVDTTERAPKDKKILQMLLDGELDAVLGETSDDARLKPLFPDPKAEAERWSRQHGTIPVNHLVVVTSTLANNEPDAVREVYRMLKASKEASKPQGAVDFVPFGVEGVRKSLELIISYAAQQALITRKFSVDELFDATTLTMS